MVKACPLVLLRHAAFAVLFGVAVSASAAQGLYRVTAPDGSVTFTDRPPPDARSRVEPVGRGGTAPTAAALPVALREPVARFPVVLYTIPDCAPCERGRALLRERGVPYREVRADAESDRDVWRRTVGSADAPALAVGRQVLRGFAADEWQSTLDLAGYPRQSRLPPNFPPPAVEPLVARRAAEPAPEAEPAAAPTPLPEIPQPSGGIRF